MPVRLSIEMISPLTEDDRDLLAGLAVMTVAIANREINQHPVEEPSTCGALEYVQVDNDEGPVATGKVCIGDVGHLGRHKYRPVDFSSVGMN